MRLLATVLVLVVFLGSLPLVGLFVFLYLTEERTGFLDLHEGFLAGAAVCTVAAVVSFWLLWLLAGERTWDTWRRFWRWSWERQ